MSIDLVLGLAAIAIIIRAALQLAMPEQGARSHASSLAALLLAMFVLACVCVPSFDAAAGAALGSP